MGGKHLKRLRTERAKVKLKKKPLPKGQNITDTTFKVKKIILVEQLKKVGGSEPVSSRNVPLKDLLALVHHHNVTSRLNALKGIEELIINFPDVLQGPSLRSILHNALILVCDVESKVRKSVANLLTTLFNCLNEDQIASFHESLNVHLDCAITHIDVKIQRDSLLLLDVIIKYAPEIIKQNHRTIIRNFTRILSAYKYGSQSEILLTKGSKGDLAVSRTQILNRLYEMLMIIYPASMSNAAQVKEIKASETPSFSIRTVTKQYREVPNMSIIFNKYHKTSEINQEPCDISCLTSGLMPLLFEIWAEFSPVFQNDGFIRECIISESTANLMLVLLQIIELIHDKNLEHEDETLVLEFVKNYKDSFYKSFLLTFPYAPSAGHMKQSSAMDIDKREKSLDSNHYVSQNLLLCYLYYCFKIQSKSKQHEAVIGKYLKGSLAAQHTQGVQILGKITEKILFSKFGIKRKETFLTNVVEAFQSSRNVARKAKLFDVLIRVALTDDLTELHNHPAFCKSLSELPHRLCDNKLPVEVVNALWKLVSRSKMSKNVSNKLENKIENILTTLPNLQVERLDRLEGQKLVANILYYCSKDVIEKVLFKTITQELEFPTELKSYLINIFQLRLKNT